MLNKHMSALALRFIRRRSYDTHLQKADIPLTADDLRNVLFHPGNLTSCTPWLIIRILPYISALWAALRLSAVCYLQNTGCLYLQHVSPSLCFCNLWPRRRDHFNCWISAAVRRWPRVTDQNSSETKGESTGALHTVIQSSHGPSVEETVTDNSDSLQPAHQHILPAFWQQSPSL